MWHRCPNDMSGLRHLRPTTGSLLVLFHERLDFNVQRLITRVEAAKQPCTPPAARAPVVFQSNPQHKLSSAALNHWCGAQKLSTSKHKGSRSCGPAQPLPVIHCSAS